MFRPTIASLILTMTLTCLLFQNCGQGFSTAGSSLSPSTTEVDANLQQDAISKVFDVRLWSSTELVRIYLFDAKNPQVTNQATLALMFANETTNFATLTDDRFQNFLQFEPKVFEVLALSSQPGFIYLANDAGSKLMSLQVEEDKVSILWEVNLLKPITKQEFSQSQLTIMNGIKSLYVGGNEIQNVALSAPQVGPYVSSCPVDQHLLNGACVSNVRSCSISNGTGSQIWNGMVWAGLCIGYTLASN